MQGQYADGGRLHGVITPFDHPPSTVANGKHVYLAAPPHLTASHASSPSIYVKLDIRDWARQYADDHIFMGETAPDLVDYNCRVYTADPARGVLANPSRV